MQTFFESVGGRKMAIGILAVVAIVLLSLLGDLSEADAVSAIWKIVAVVAGGIAVEDGLSKAKGF